QVGRDLVVRRLQVAGLEQDEAAVDAMEEGRCRIVWRRDIESRRVGKVPVLHDAGALCLRLGVGRLGDESALILAATRGTGLAAAAGRQKRCSRDGTASHYECPPPRDLPAA